MRKDAITFIALAIIVCLYTWVKSRPSSDVGELLKQRRVLYMDGSDGKRDMMYLRIDSLLIAKDCRQAEKIIDSILNISDKDIRLVDFKGLALLCKGDAKGSISWFNKAMKLEGTNFPRALGHRAEAYSSLNMFDSAIADLKECAATNYDYTKVLGKTYEKNGQKDSAVKYYQIFLDNYPESLSVKESLARLKS
jgi:tetratricopeptide (TPR) repeat protein